MSIRKSWWGEGRVGEEKRGWRKGETGIAVSGELIQKARLRRQKRRQHSGLSALSKSRELSSFNKLAADMTKVLVDAAKLTPNDQILFAFGDCIMKGQTKLKTYSLLSIVI
jgi:hypothetical protein